MRNLFFVLVLTPLVLWSQQGGSGRIVGKVVDSENGEDIIGANVTVEGMTRGAASDIEGKFAIAVPAGKYTILVSAVSHAKKRIVDIQVDAGKDTKVNVILETEAVKMNEVVIEARVNASYEAALLKKQKNSVVISDALSAEQIKRTPDATSGDALRRLTGISLVDNKFVFVRGVTDRYNQTTLNGTAVSSTDAEKKSFSFDMLPSSLLENTVVIKTATPDVRGDFTGGLVQLSTLDFPESRVAKLSVSTSYNTFTTGKNIYESPGGSLDWLGMDNGSRKLPDASSASELARLLPNNWNPRSRTAPVSASVSLSYGDHYNLERSSGQPDDLGYIAALTYRNGFQHNDKIINDYAIGRYNVGSRDDYSVLWGALANLSYKFGGLHKLSLKNSFTQTAEDQIGSFVSQDANTTLENRYTVVNWNQRSMYSTQLGGEHNLMSLGGLNIEWKLATSYANQQVPDRKQVTYSRPQDSPNAPFAVAINQRSWSDLNDHTNMGGLDVQLPVTTSMKIKAGGMLERRKMDYRIRYFNVTPDYIGGITSALTQASLATIYDPAHFGSGKFLMDESSKASDSYNANSQLSAVYLMADVPFALFEQRLRLVGGARLEKSELHVRVPKTLAPNGPVDETIVTDNDLLPSANLTYTVNEITNIRLSYSHSVNRPEFRELASTGFYDFIKYELVGGNPELKRALSRNFDVRIEIFPDLGELFAVSYFHKGIDGAIEEKLVQTATRTRTWFNSDHATNAGWEFEVRKSFGFVSPALKDLSITANYTVIRSTVKVWQTIGNSIETRIEQGTRLMQGQSPYLINLSAMYTLPSTGTNVNVLFNRFGRRMDAVGFLASDIYEEPRELVDLALTQPLPWSVELKLTVKNLTNSHRTLTRDGILYDQTSTGRTFSIQFSKSL